MHTFSPSLTRSMPLVSVILPSYNYARFLDEALGSVLSQTYRQFEIIAVDDGSTDGSVQVLRSWQNRYPDKIRFLENIDPVRHHGLVENYRRALTQARGELIAFLEADDRWRPDNLEKKVRALTENPSVGVVYSRYRPFGHGPGSFYWKLYEQANLLRAPKRGRFMALDQFLRRNPVASFSHFVMRREDLQDLLTLKTPRFNYDWWILAHLSLKTYFYFIPEVLCDWRIHAQSAGFSAPGPKMLWRLRTFLLILCRSLEHENQRTVLDPQRRAENKKQLAGCLNFLVTLKTDRRAALGLAMTRHPLECLRFVAFLMLKTLLFRRQRDRQPNNPPTSTAS